MHDHFMKLALKEAIRGQEEGGIPIGSVLTRNGRLIGRGHNRRVQERDPILHAEIACLQAAGRRSSYEGAVLYSTLMPCYMCAGAAIQFGIRHVVVGDSQNFDGARRLMEEHGITVDVLDDPVCIDMMRDFIVVNPKLWNEDIGR